MAKDGLHQYRNIVGQTAVTSLETIIKVFFFFFFFFDLQFFFQFAQ